MAEYRSIELNEWHKTGDGANVESYTSKDDNLMLKVFKSDSTEENALRDYNMAAKVAAMGIATPEVYEIVRVGDGYGVIYQNLKNKKSYSRLVVDNPEKIKEYAADFAKMSKELHSIPCNTDIGEGKLLRIRKGIEKAKFIGRYKTDLYKLLDETTTVTTCLHGDLHTGNLVRSEGQDYWIDLDRFTYGNPILDIAHMNNMYSSLSWLPFIQNITHMNKKQLNEFWDCFVEEYYGYTKKDTEKLKELERKICIFNGLDLIEKNYTSPGLLSDLITLILILPKVRKVTLI